MDRAVFAYKLRDVSGVPLSDRYAIFNKPLRLVDLYDEQATDHQFSTMDAALAFTLADGQTVGDMVDAIGDCFAIPALNGGNGSDSDNSWSGGFNHANDNGDGDAPPPHFPVEANVRIKVKTEAAVMDQFKEMFQNADHEWAYAVDEQGYVHQFVEGTASSVGIWGNKGELILHNHPNGGAFSDSDLLNVSYTAARGIVASGRNGEYIFTKGTHFKADKFAKAVKNAKLKGKDYDDAANKWLKKNAKKFGYKYEFKKTGTKVGTYQADDKTSSAANKQGKQISLGGKTYRVTSVQKDIAGNTSVLSAKVFRNGQWVDVNMTKGLSNKLGAKYTNRG